jgi:hypothetical protein
VKRPGPIQRRTRPRRASPTPRSELRAAIVAIAASAGRAAGELVGPAPARSYAPIEKHGQLVSEAWLARVRAMPCAFCGEGPWPRDEGRTIDAHHVALVSQRRERFDWLVVPACRGPRSRHCHDRAQRRDIPLADQHRALGELLCSELRRLHRSELREVLGEMAAGLGMEIGR